MAGPTLPPSFLLSLERFLDQFYKNALDEAIDWAERLVVWDQRARMDPADRHVALREHRRSGNGAFGEDA